RTRHGCSYNQYPALGFDARNRDLVLPVGAPPTVRTTIEPNLRTSPIRTRHGCSYGGYGVVTFGVGAPPPGANWAGTHSHPARVLLQQIREFAPVAAAPTARRSRMPTPHISCASSTASSHSWARCSSS